MIISTEGARGPSRSMAERRTPRDSETGRSYD